MFGYGPDATPLSTQSAPASIMDGSHCLDVTDAWLVDSVYSYVAQSMPVQCIAVPGVPDSRPTPSYRGFQTTTYYLLLEILMK